MHWHEYFIRLSEGAAMKSKDESTQVGCIIVGPENQILSTGYNGFPRGVDEDSSEAQQRWTRPDKYLWVEHAERNAIYNAARHGISLRGARSYINWGGTVSCTACARAMIQVGITAIIMPTRPFEGYGARHLKHSAETTHDDRIVEVMLAEAGVEVIRFPVDFSKDFSVLRREAYERLRK